MFLFFPYTFTLPEYGFSKPHAISASVDLPQPFSPRRDTMLPPVISRFKSSIIRPLFLSYPNDTFFILRITSSEGKSLVRISGMHISAVFPFRCLIASAFVSTGSSDFTAAAQHGRKPAICGLRHISCAICLIGPDCTNPSLMNTTLSAFANTLSVLCSAIITVIPYSRLILQRRSATRSDIIGSSMEHASSSIRIFGLAAMAHAMLSICFSPPESLSTSLSSMPLIPKYAAVSAMRVLT